jgi:radical SAM protein with 4Fe4S-binding SPASM domain
MDKIKEYLKRVFCIENKVPTTAQVEITNLCNLDCLMCPRKKLNIKYKEMSLDYFKEIVVKLERIKRIILTGWGEPLFHKNLPEMIKFCTKRGIFTSFTSNGLLLTPELSKRLIDAGIKEITFSIDSLDEDNEFGHINKECKENIERLSKMPRAPDIRIQSVLSGTVENLIEISNFAKKIGAKRMNLSRIYLGFSPEMTRPTKKEEKKMVRELEMHCKRIGLPLEMIQYFEGRGIVRALYPILKGTLGIFGKRCLRVYDYIYINCEGIATPCCLLPSYKVGDLNKEDLKSIYSSKAFDSFRKNHNKKVLTCKSCDLWKIRYNK